MSYAKLKLQSENSATFTDHDITFERRADDAIIISMGDERKVLNRSQAKRLSDWLDEEDT